MPFFIPILYLNLSFLLLTSFIKKTIIPTLLFINSFLYFKQNYYLFFCDFYDFLYYFFYIIHIYIII